MRELFQGIGALYRLVWLGMVLMTRKGVAIAGVVVLGMLTVLAGKPATDALPYAVLWLLAGGTCRMVIRVLPAPGGAGGRVPAEKRPPPAMLAVSVTPEGGAGGCPGIDRMAAGMIEELRYLLLDPSQPTSGPP